MIDATEKEMPERAMAYALTAHNPDSMDESLTNSREASRSLNKRRLKTMMREKGIGPSSEVLRSMANEKRLSILYLLQAGEKSVLELAAALTLRQPTVSQQLARLRADNLVKTRRNGQTIYYSLNTESTEEILDLLARIYGQP